jgi:hypothetical protein
MKYLALGALALTIAACSGAPGGDRCSSAQTALATAQAAIAAYPDPTKVPAQLLVALEVAKAAMPILCPAPTVVLVP